MALATNTSPGEIQLAGDLGGNNDATAPELSNTGVTAGNYSLVDLTVDSKGRITAVSSNVPTSISTLIPDATTTQRGLVKIGDGLQISVTPTPGLQDINFTSSITGTEATSLSACATYKVDIHVDNTTLVHIETTGNNLTTLNDVLNILNGALSNATATIANGKMTITSVLTGKLSTIDILNDGLFSCMPIYDSLGLPVDGVGDCEISPVIGTNAAKGILQVGSGLSVVNGVVSVDGAVNITPATTTTIGGVIVPTAGNIDVAVDGSISVPLGTNAALGVVKIGTGLSVTGGVVSADILPDATTTVKGKVVVPASGNIDISAGSISVPLATTGNVGVVSVGGGLKIDGTGLLQIDTTSYPIATTTTVGAVIVPTAGNIDVAGDGSISVPLATTGNVGVVSIGTNIDVDGAGEISMPVATAISVGLISVGTGLSVDGSGVLSAAPALATTSTIGVVSVPTAGNIDVDGSGNISVPLAVGSTVAGVVKSADTNNITISAGNIDVGTNVPKLSANNIWTETQSGDLNALGAGGHSLNVGNIYNISTSVNTTGAFGNFINGTWYTVYINNNTNYIGFPFSLTNLKFRGGNVPNISVTGTSILTMLAYNGSLYCELGVGYL